MFYDTFSLLCSKKGVSCNKAAVEIGLSNALPTKWKKTGATPGGDTLDRIGKYFGVTTDYLLGLSAQSQLDTLAYQISQLRKELSAASPERAAEIESDLAMKEESYEDIAFGMRMPAQKNTPTEMVLDEGEKLLINLYRRLPEDKRQLVLQTVKAFAESL